MSAVIQFNHEDHDPLVASILCQKPVSCSTRHSVGEASRLMRQYAISCILVTFDDKSQGIISEQDLTHYLALRQRRHTV